MEITKEQVEQWCDENNYAIIDLKKSHIDKEIIFKIAMKATGVTSITKSDQKPEHSFARFLAVAYLDDYYATGVLARMIEINYTTISYARNMWLLKESTELKYFKNWQQSAILYFREKLNDAKEKLNGRIDKRP